MYVYLMCIYNVGDIIFSDIEIQPFKTNKRNKPKLSFSRNEIKSYLKQEPA